MPYLGKQSEQVGVSVQKYEYLQGTDTTTGTTVFSIPSDSADHVNVWLNGVLLVEGGSDDYSKSNTAITFNSAPADGDIVRCDVIESFALPDALKSSGDTMSGALKLNGGIKQQTSADLSGTYADHQVMLSDSYSVTGDVTISDNLVLAKLSDDSNAITISNDTSTRTITGTGSLEASTLAQTPNASLTGMTGTIGSGATLSSDAVYPSGHVLDTGVAVGTGANLDVGWATSASYQTTGLSVTVTHGTGNKVLLIGAFACRASGGGTDKGLYVGLDGSATNQIDSQLSFADSDDASILRTAPYLHLDTPSGTSTTYTVKIKGADGANILFQNTQSTLVWQVIKG